MDFYASDAFLTALAKDYYHAKNFDFQRFEVQGRQVRLAVANGGKILATGPFYDYVKTFPLDGPSLGTVNYIPKLLTSTVALDDQEPAASVPATTQDPAPIVMWERFATWDEYLSLLRKRSKNLLPGRGRKLRKLSAAYGEPTFNFDNPDVDALNLCLKWKAQQYAGGHETLEDPDALAMLQGLFRDGHLILSTLEVGGQYVAVHAGFLWQGEYLDVLPTYDPAFAQYGVGKELLLRMLEFSYQEGHRSFDFLQGAEPYKWDFATHVQLIESYGSPPLARRTRDALERTVKGQLLALSPHLFYGVKRLVLQGRRRIADARNRLRAEKNQPGRAGLNESDEVDHVS